MNDLKFIKLALSMCWLVCAAQSMIDEDQLVKTCNNLFARCMCSYQTSMRRFNLYCNDPSLNRMPNFRHATAQFERQHNESRLTFNKLDFSQSGLKSILKDDLKYLRLDLAGVKSKLDFHEGSFEAFIESLKETMPPIYHLDFDNIQLIEDGAFKHLIDNSTKGLLKVRLSNSIFNYMPTQKPFEGLRANELHLNNISDEYILNTIFSQSIISELAIKNCLNFVGFIGLSESHSRGKILHKFVATNSFKRNELTADMLPSFVDDKQFTEITVTQCLNLKMIKEKTFCKYPNLKRLLLSRNGLVSLDRNCFSCLAQLEKLDLNSNPIHALEGFTFKHLISLKTLYLENTNIKKIASNTFRGLVALNKLKLKKNFILESIEGKAFEDSKQTLNEIDLKETSIRLIETVDEDQALKSRKGVWLDGLNLTLLHIDLKDFDALKNTSMCALSRYLPASTLVSSAHPNQQCNCLVYFIYRGKHFPHISNWERKAPACYRNKSTAEIVSQELKCNLKSFDLKCHKESSQVRNLLSQKAVESSIRQLPKINFVKLMQVLAVLTLLTLISILVIIFVYKIKWRFERSRPSVKAQNSRLRKSSSIASSTQSGAFNANMKPLLVMPPSVIPKFNSKIGEIKRLKREPMKTTAGHDKLRTFSYDFEH